MIAIAPPITSATPDDRFLVMLPVIREKARFAFRRCRAKVREELITEVIANAFSAFSRLVRQGRVDQAFATPLANYAIRQVRAGRRVGQSRNTQDLFSLVLVGIGSFIGSLVIAQPAHGILDAPAKLPQSPNGPLFYFQQRQGFLHALHLHVQLPHD